MEFQEFMEYQNTQKNNPKSFNLDKDSAFKDLDVDKGKKRGNFILRQELTNLTPECSLKLAIICNSILALLFAAVGAPIIYSRNTTVQYEVEYDVW